MNRVFIRSIWIAVSLLALDGCAIDHAGKQWWALQETSFRQLQPGKTTKADVRTLFGSPINAVAFPRQGEEVWDYRFLNGSIIMLAWVYFDRDGVYKYYTAQPDPARYDPGAT
jgi:outer membrane protein assembly factor BamE (lipoprotein component of BamABCDE complex)